VVSRVRPGRRVETQQHGVRVRMNERLLNMPLTPGQPVGRARHRARGGFSLIELLVVMVVTVILAGILMPALAGLRDQTDRIISGSNMRQIGMGMTMYATDNLGRLPYSAMMHTGNPTFLQEMMVTYIQPNDSTNLQRLLEGNHDTLLPLDPYAELMLDTRGFEGIGLLYINGYTSAPDVFYCPAHRGDHPLERYAADYDRPTGIIYGNYQYRGDIDIDPETGVRRALTLERDANRVLLTDGMRTKRDFNHRVGYNSLIGDGSVFWRSDLEERIYRLLPNDKMLDGDVGDLYAQLWEIIDKTSEIK
jgi:prepilin-type N-terminal cleavage/methylation domain-containing protein